MSKTCVFCKIINKEIQSTILYEDDEIMAFVDMNPVAPTHILFIPKKHIDSMVSINEEDTMLLGKLFIKISEIAKEKGFSKRGYRVVTNTGNDGGQTVSHLHLHLIAGRSFHWPPG